MASVKTATLKFCIELDLKAAVRAASERERCSIANINAVMIRDYCRWVSYGDSIAVLFPQQRQVHGFARGFQAAGIDVEVQQRDAPIDFSNPIPKLMTYHQAKGLTFDSVFLPRLNQSSFPGKLSERVGHLCFVGVSRAVKWVYLSGKNQALIAPMQELAQETNRRFLETMISSESVGLLSSDPMGDSHLVAADMFGLD